MTSNLPALPAGWSQKTVGEISKIQSGFPVNKKNEIENGYVHFRTHNISTSGKLNFDYLVKVENSMIKANCNTLKKDDILFNNTNSTELVGKTALVDQDYPYAFSNHLSKIELDQSIALPSFFVYYFMDLFTKGYFVSICNKWIGQSGVNTTMLKEITIPLPPLNEQKRLVTLLDTLFAKIDRSIELLSENITAADALLPSALNTVFCEFKETCETQKFDEIKSSNVIGLVRNSNEQHINHNFKYVKMNNITNDNHFTWRNITGVNATSEEAIKFSLQKGDFLFNTRNSIELVGKTCLFDSDEKNVLFNNNIMRVRFKTNVLSSFIAYQFSSQYIKQQLEKIKSGTTSVAAIYYKTLKDIDLIIPPLNIQIQTVEYLDSIRTKVEILKRVQNDKIKNLKALKASILDRAFKGEL
ncbi:MAG: restriction endonuclease subunit S [Sulfuricurvum sp.]|nr:restriction endonuclease subunit S [Sulfuricurvum sp.]